MKTNGFLALCCCLAFIACNDDNEMKGQFDPSQPVTFSGFTPKEGSVRTKLFITGNNFGTDTASVDLYVGGQPTQIIGLKNTEIYAMVPPRAYDNNIRVVMKGAAGDTVTDYTFTEPFNYIPKTVVGTLLRNVDQDGNSSNTDGSFDVASINSADWMMFDPQREEKGINRIYTSNYYDGLRIMDLDTEEVSTAFGKTGQYHTIYSFSFSEDGDTLLYVDDNGQGSSFDLPNIFYALRSQNFRRLYPYNYGPCSYSCVYMPDGNIFYSTWVNGRVLRMERNGRPLPNIDSNPTECFRLSNLFQTDGAHVKMTLHPSKKYMYVYCTQMKAITKCDYNFEKQLFESPTVVAGSLTQSGFAEGTGTSARFDEPWAGVFVRNPEYEDNPPMITVNGETVPEYYDFYFTDHGNDCIFKITPTQVVTMVAGRSNYTSDNSYIGYVDGDPLLEARFHDCAGLCYDPEGATFYIGDIENKAIRYMREE